jgi:hypothetical protein
MSENVAEDDVIEQPQEDDDEEKDVRCYVLIK